jgi:hypothetical protein
MTRRTIPLLKVALLIVLCASSDAYADQEMLASAKNLYEAASYEEALTELTAIDNSELVDVVDTYRALCFLGLGRVQDAEQVLGLIVTRKPLFVLSDTEYSPRVVALFGNVRKKALPAAAQQLYSAARTDFENKRYALAAEGFRQVLQVIADIAPESQTATLVDLKELSGGFLALAEVRASSTASPVMATPAAKSPAAASSGVAPPASKPSAAASPGTTSSAVSSRSASAVPPPEARPPAAPVAAPAAAPVTVVPALSANALREFYTLLDDDVTPPAVVDQQIPRWGFSANLPSRVFTGTIELVIDERGQVEDVSLLKTVFPPYDPILLEAARKWRYAPALKNGKPVRFKRVMVINLDPRVQRAR